MPTKKTTLKRLLLLDGSWPTTDDDERQQPRSFRLRNERVRGPLEALEQAVADVAGVAELLQEEHVVFLRTQRATQKRRMEHTNADGGM